MNNRADQTAQTNHTLRLIIDPPQNGIINMATDEAILESVNAGAAAGVLRFYRWSEPTISLGYFQKFEEVARQDEPIRAMPVVRRQTGGGAILHDDELTYSLILPITENGPASKIETLYQLVHDAFIDALADWGVIAQYRGGTADGNSQRGPFFCFAREHRLDLTVNGDKILGSAQRRIKHAVLQHGSLILACHFPQQPCTDVERQANCFDLNRFINRTAQTVAGRLDCSACQGVLNSTEIEHRDRLSQKYHGDPWTRQR